MDKSNDAIIAKLNDVVELLGMISSGQLKHHLGRGNPYNPVAGCSVDCDCRSAYCGCKGHVSSLEKYSLVSYPEYLQLREDRIDELKKELNRLEIKK